MKMYEVGGCVRDEIMGRKSSDIDFSVVLEPSDVPAGGTAVNFDPFDFMVMRLKDMGFQIFLETPEHLTVRAQFPRGERAVVADSSDIRKGYKNLTADFVLARKEGTYTDGRRPDSVQVGTLEDDLARRDFTMNAIAKRTFRDDPDADYFIDPFNGVQDINDGVIRAVGNAFDRLTEDALRAVRALRFSVTLGFRIDHELKFAMESAAVLYAVKNNIADERIKDELNKMFKHSALDSLAAFTKYPALTAAVFSGRVNLEATMKSKGYS